MIDMIVIFFWESRESNNFLKRGDQWVSSCVKVHFCLALVFFRNIVWGWHPDIPYCSTEGGSGQVLLSYTLLLWGKPDCPKKVRVFPRTQSRISTISRLHFCLWTFCKRIHNMEENFHVNIAFSKGGWRKSRVLWRHFVDTTWKERWQTLHNKFHTNFPFARDQSPSLQFSKKSSQSLRHKVARINQ